MSPLIRLLAASVVNSIKVSLLIIAIPMPIAIFVSSFGSSLAGSKSVILLSPSTSKDKQLSIESGKQNPLETFL